MPHRLFFTYALSNPRRTVLYIGMTNDLICRLREHRDGIGSDFTRRYNATDLVWFESFTDVNAAIAREKQIKAWRRDWKWDLVREHNAPLRDLTAELVHL